MLRSWFMAALFLAACGGVVEKSSVAPAGRDAGVESGGTAGESGACAAACGQACCGAGETCFQGECCSPHCEGKSCGADQCGGSCGNCGSCNGTAIPCQFDGKCPLDICCPATCDKVGAQCGIASDQCAGVLDCGGCPVPQTCNMNKCQ